MSLKATYRKLLHNHFMAVQSVQTGLLMGAGDCIAQTAVEKADWPRYDLKRTAQFAGLGLCFVVSLFRLKIAFFSSDWCWFGAVLPPLATVARFKLFYTV